MRKSTRILMLFILAALILALPTTALANKKIWTARMSYANELHDVVGSRAAGSASFASFPDGTLRFMISVTGLSGQPGGAHVHAPAGEDANAPILFTLCGNPSPAVLATCTFSDGVMQIQGTITSSFMAQWGVTGADLIGYFDDGQAYVNVHTALNPAGEARGQLHPR
ncbi:MAG: CHRD domain-containing protein [Chloroflexi bacterium]|nr:CHRD domain-containing protein [Chloroflexota bacterium]